MSNTIFKVSFTCGSSSNPTHPWGGEVFHAPFGNLRSECSILPNIKEDNINKYLCIKKNYQEIPNKDSIGG